jgi:hypothetical protein
MRNSETIFLLKFIDRKSELWHRVLSVNERRFLTPTESGRSRLAWRNRRDRLKGRGRDIGMRHEALAPVRLSRRFETGWGFAGENSWPHMERSSVLSPVLGLFALKTGSLCLRPRTDRPRKSDKRAKIPRKRHQSLALLQGGPGGLRRRPPVISDRCCNYSGRQLERLGDRVASY